MSGRTVADVVALDVDGRSQLTYEAWEARSNAVARGLAARGVAGGNRVGLLFDAPGWAEFAVADLGVRKAGAVAVLLAPGAARPDLQRAIAHAGVAGLLCPPHLAPPGLSEWTAAPDAIGRGHDTAPLAATTAPPELVYPPAPLAPVRPWSRPVPELDVPGGWLVHAWAPGSLAGQRVVATLLARTGCATAISAAFDPDRLCAMVEERRAVALGLTPALAAALLASGALGAHDLSSLGQVLLSGSPTSRLRAALEEALPGVAIRQLPDHASTATDAPPVAVSQEGMLWHEQFAPGSFNLPCLVRRYEGPLDEAALESALAELVRRHQPLRSTFALVDGVPRHVVGDAAGRRLVVHDLTAVAPEGRDDEASRLIAEASGRPFDLVTGPLFDPQLVRFGDDDHLLLVRVHHAVFDDWSVDLFRRELSALYAARLAGTPSPLVEPAVTFAEFSRRQRARLAGPAGAEERNWWREELDGAPLSVQLPIADGRPEPGEAVRLDLPSSLVADLRALAPQLRATPFMTVLAAFSILLGRVTGQDDLLIATVVAHRNTSDLEPLIGCFTKKIPLRLRVGGDPHFSELVARTRTSLLGSLSHQGLAFDAALQAALGPPAADHGVVPQVAVVFQGETPQQVKLALPGLAIGPYQARPGARAERHFSAGAEQAWGDGIYLGTFLILSLLETKDGMALVARGVFSPPAVHRLLDDFQALLAEMVADPSRRIGELRAGAPAGVVDVRGFRASRSRLEGALGRCPGAAQVSVAVRDVDGQACLTASVAPDGEPAPTLTGLRRALWAELPGTLWPAEAVTVPAPGRTLPAEPDPTATVLAAMWVEHSGRGDIGPRSSYWQDFSFLPVLAEAREAGLALGDELVVRCRTLETLAVACLSQRG